MTRTNKGIFSLCIPLLAILIIFTSCEDPGNVGSGFVDRPELVYDTLTISNTEELNYQGYSGKLSFIPIGHYSDQLFGDISAQGMIKPTLTPSAPDSLELGDFSLQIEFLVDSLESYGDTTSFANFSIYEITSPWRGSVLRIDDEIPYGNQVGSFTIGAGQTEVFVSNLSQQWIDKYKSYYNSEDANIDSLYNYEFGGLVIIPDQSNSKISFPRAGDSRFLMINEAGTDTVNVPFHDWGYTLDRSASSHPANTFPLMSTLEGMLSLTIPDSVLKADNSTKNIIRADLVFHEAEEELSSSLDMGEVRLPIGALSLNLAENSDPEYQYQFGNAEFVSTSQEEETGYKINITNYVNNVIYGNETRQELILGIGSSSGALRSTLLYNETAPEQLQPKLIITSLVD